MLLDITRTVNLRTHRFTHGMDEKVCRRRLEVCGKARPGPKTVELRLLHSTGATFVLRLQDPNSLFPVPS